MSRVLIIDDTQAIRDLLRRLLERRGHLVVGELSDGFGAVAHVEQRSPDLVILDYDMPVIAGPETARRIKAAFSEVTIAGFTSGGQQSCLDLIDSGADVVFSKSDLCLLLDYLETFADGRPMTDDPRQLRSSHPFGGDSSS